MDFRCTQQRTEMACDRRGDQRGGIGGVTVTLGVGSLLLAASKAPTRQ
jgi:hypothetical protein